MTVELEGIEEVQKMIEKLQAVGSAVKGATLNNINRTDGADKTNSEIMEEMRLQGRDFAAIDSAEAEKIAVAFAEESERLMNQSADAKPTAVAAKSVTAAMQEYMRIVRDHITQGKIENKQLSKNREAEKIRRWGKAYPIGIATTNLWDNLNPDEVKNIRPIIKKR